MCVAPGCGQLDFGAAVEALAAYGYDDDKVDELGERIGFADTVSVEQLAAAGVPNRVVFDLRRRLDPRSVSQPNSPKVSTGTVTHRSGVLCVFGCVCLQRVEGGRGFREKTHSYSILQLTRQAHTDTHAHTHAHTHKTISF